MACSTAKALEWDVAWSRNPDPSGRAALGVHVDAYKENGDVSNGEKEVSADISIKKPKYQDGSVEVVVKG